MGRAIVREPKAFLFDEPLSNLDARLREHMRAEIKKLHRELGTTSIYVTHDQIEAMTMADRIVAMNGGIAQQIGQPARTLRSIRPICLSPDFIGSPAMNLLDATLQDETGAQSGAGPVAVMIGRERLCAVQRPAPMPGNGRIIAGIRPERITIGAGPQDLPAVVELIEATGIGMILHLNAHGPLLKVYTTDRAKIASGDNIRIKIDPRDVLLFDADSGRRLRAISSGAP